MLPVRRVVADESCGVPPQREETHVGEEVIAGEISAPEELRGAQQDALLGEGLTYVL